MNLDFRLIPYRPFDRQVAFHESPARFKGAFSGNRGGKTLAGAYEFIVRIFRDLAAGKGRTPPAHTKARLHRLLYWIVAPDYKLGKTFLDTVLRRLPPETIVKYNNSDHTLWLVGGVKVELRSAEDPRRLVAESCNGVWIDEAPRVNAEAYRGAIRARVADQLGWIILTGSPLGGRLSWVYTDFVAVNGRDEIESFTWTTEQNPYISRSEVALAKRRLPESHYKRDWLASWDSDGGAVFEEFRPDVHVCSESELRMRYAHSLRGKELRSLFQRVCGAIDWGWKDAGCILVIGKINDDDYVVLEESYAPGRHVLGDGVTWTSECHRLKEKWGVDLFVCDPSEPRDIATLCNNGINATGAVNDVLHGIRRAQETMHPRVERGETKPGLTVLSSCTNLIDQLQTYSWKPTKDGSSFLDEPKPGQQDHAVDPLRYGLLELNPVPVMERLRGRAPHRPIG